MSEPPDLRDLVGEGLSPGQLEELRRVDALLRSVPPPPAEVPPSLTRAVRGITLRAPLWTARRVAAGAALAAALAALFFGIGFWASADGLEARLTVALEATENAPGASGLIRVGGRDEESGNWALELEVSGLPKLPEGGYYVLWLAKDGRYGVTCGTFNVRDGTTTVRMSASYRLKSFDAWVISAQLPGQPADASPAWLLQAPI